MKDMDQLLKMAKQYRKLHDQKKVIMDTMNSLKRRMEDVLPYKETIKLEGLNIRKTDRKGYTISYKELREAHPQAYDDCVRTTWNRVVTINESKKKDKEAA